MQDSMVPENLPETRYPGVDVRESTWLLTPRKIPEDRIIEHTICSPVGCELFVWFMLASLASQNRSCELVEIMI